jgi:chloride channel 3/4/5
MNILFKECIPPYSHDICSLDLTVQGTVVIMLLFGAVVKGCSTIYTFGLGVPAGIFVPSMVVGACVGRAFGSILLMIHLVYPNLSIFSYCDPNEPCINPGIFAIVGAVAALCGVTRMTISLVIVVFELTGIGTMILPLMITVLMAKLSGGYFVSDSIYDSMIKQIGFPYIGKDLITKKNFVRNIMTPIKAGSHINLPLDTNDSVVYDSARSYKIEKAIILKLLDQYDFSGFPVLQNLKFCGYVERSEILKQHENNLNPYFIFTMDQFSDYETEIIIKDDYIRVRPETEVSICLEFFKKMGCKYLFVTNAGFLQGIVTRKEFFFGLENGRNRLFQ